MSSKKILFICFFIPVLYTTGQEMTRNKFLCDSLSKQSSKIWKLKNDSAKIAAGENFFIIFQETLNTPASFDTEFDSIYGISRAVSDDKNLRIFTWNIPLSDGSNHFFGIVQFKGNERIIIPLHSSNVVQNIPERQLVNESNWYGALYYKIVQQQSDKGIIYTLLGWDGYNSISNRKLIDIVSLDERGKIVFGMPVFKTAEGIKSRIVFEFAENANMLLRYDYQAIRMNKGRKIRKVNAWLIVMDRLIPMDPTLGGIYKYYVPAGDVYDGFLYKNGYWVLVEDIEVANK